MQVKIGQNCLRVLRNLNLLVVSFTELHVLYHLWVRTRKNMFVSFTSPLIQCEKVGFKIGSV